MSENGFVLIHENANEIAVFLEMDAGNPGLSAVRHSLGPFRSFYVYVERNLAVPTGVANRVIWRRLSPT
jgi:hypothetical protein